MINWEMLSPRNLFVIAALSLLAIGIFNHFSKAAAPVAVGA
jgi:hypothetical protein